MYARREGVHVVLGRGVGVGGVWWAPGWRFGDLGKVFFAFEFVFEFLSRFVRSVRGPTRWLCLIWEEEEKEKDKEEEEEERGGKKEEEDAKEGEEKEEQKKIKNKNNE